MLEAVKTIVAQGLVSSMLATLFIAVLGVIDNLPMYFAMIGSATAVHDSL